MSIQGKTCSMLAPEPWARGGQSAIALYRSAANGAPMALPGKIGQVRSVTLWR
jgi:hypothetical protein